MTEECIFCKIIKGEVPANIVYQDEDMVVFHNIKPSAPIHVLMIPVLHIESVNALEEKHGSVISKMMIKTKEIAQLLGIRQSGYKLIINVEKGAGQVIFHLHIHLIGGWNEQKQFLAMNIKNNTLTV
ncbi:MAG: histidine triad nucleotide-binding protein [Candidatus Methanoperedens sp.]|nr:histidine triad nucleotide-binding protein [Candidatus Methanoperedens sp.]